MSCFKDHTNIDTLRAIAQMQDSQIQMLTQEVTRLRQELRELRGEPGVPVQQDLAVLQEQLAEQNRRLYGRSSEKSETTTTGRARKNQTKRTGHGPKKQPHLLHIVREHELDDADTTCPKCGGTLQEMKGQSEQYEEITVIQRQFVVVNHKRKKYRCTCQACIETASGPYRLMPSGRYSVEFAAEVAVDKYHDHLPLQRQVKRMEREGLHVDAVTLWDQIQTMATHLQPSYEAILATLRKLDIVYADETPWPFLGTQSKKWYLWALASDNLVAYRADPSRNTDAAKQLLGDFEGMIVSDGYKVYQNLSKRDQALPFDGSIDTYSITNAHCWAHVRRKFIVAEKNFPYECKRIINYIKALYRLESKAEKADDVSTQKHLIRNRSSRKVVDRLLRYVRSLRPLPESGLGKALTYMYKLWPGLIVFLDNPRIPLDTNHVERALRGPVVGRKNHLGSKSQRGAEVAALFYTLIESAKMNGVNPKAYLLHATYRAIVDPGTATLPQDLHDIEYLVA